VENRIRSWNADTAIATGLMKLRRVTEPGVGYGVYNLWIDCSTAGGREGMNHE